MDLRVTARPSELALGRGLAALGARLRAWLARHPMLSDAALATVLVAAEIPPISAIAGRHPGLTVVMIIVLACPLIWRRRAPMVVFAVIFGLAIIQLIVIPTESNDLLPLLCAFYTIATREPHWRVLAAAVALEIAAAFTPAGWGPYSLLILISLLLGYYVRTRRAYVGALVDRAERLEHERDQQAQLTAATERARIAREVHDIVAHNIAVMTALADGAAYTAGPGSGPAAELMHQVSETGRSALSEMRRLVGVLREPPGQAPQPVLDELDDLLETVRAAGLPATLEVTGAPVSLPATAQLAVYRIIQEALTNTLKHAPGATARIRLDYQPGQVGLEITDTGPPGGPPRAAGPAGGGHGIAGMRERAALFGGQVTAGPVPGGGWRIQVTLRPEPRAAAEGEPEPLIAAEGP